MNTIIILLSLISIFLPIDTIKGKTEQNLQLKPVFKGVYYYLEKDSADEACCKHIYYLVDVKIINYSDSIAEFYGYDCTTAENIVTDTKELHVCINSCPSNRKTLIKLMPKQEFSVPVILKSKTSIDFKVRIGFVILCSKNVNSDDVFFAIEENVANLENVLWSDPIKIGLNLANPYEIN